MAMLPHDCCLCGEFAGATLLCNDCRNDLPRITLPCCPVCALPVPGGGTCGACLNQPPYFDATHCRFRYAFPVDRLVHALKYQHRLVVSAFFADALSEISAAVLAQTDLLLALPLSAERLCERGFNQALEIARPLARRFGLALAAQGYRRSIDTVPQTSLPWKERHKNVLGAFECDSDLTGTTVTVIDDVMTTGATLNEFARTLKKHGAAKVTNLVVARALRL